MKYKHIKHKVKKGWRYLTAPRTKKKFSRVVGKTKRVIKGMEEGIEETFGID